MCWTRWSLCFAVAPPRLVAPPPGDEEQEIVDGDLVYTVGSMAIGMAGRRVTLQCQDRTGRPPSNISWTLPSGQTLEPGQSVTDPSAVSVDRDRSSLTITSASSASDGSYTCRAKNVAGTDDAASTVSIYCEC